MPAKRSTFVYELAAVACILSTLASGCGSADHSSMGQAPAKTQLAADFRQVVRSAADKVFPAVVFIKVVRETYVSGKKTSQEVSGSGVILSADGEVLTNWHVVDKAVQIRCLLYDGRHFEGKLVGSDKDVDLAIVQLSIDAGARVPYAILGDSSNLKEGDFVMAMGAPWGMSRSVSIGIISCTDRYLPDASEYSLWLQTDASISPGNSGGPLVNTQGQIIGINTRGAMAGGDMGFAIPSQTIQAVVPQLLKGKVNWGWTGLRLQPLNDFDRNVFFDGTKGVIVSDTEPESPARQAGIQPRDRILKINDKQTNALWTEDLPILRRDLGLLSMQQPMRVTVQRGEQTLDFTVQPRDKGNVEGEELDLPQWNMTVKAINQFDNPSLYFYRKQGVFIYGIKYEGNARNAGLQREDILLQIENKEIQTLDDLHVAYKDCMDNIAKKHRVLVTVLRNGLTEQVVMDFSRDYEKE